MGRYRYQTRDASGNPQQGVLTADGVEEASAALRREGKFIIRLEPERGEASDASSGAVSLDLAARRVKRADVVFFAHQLAVMLETGVPISDALESIAEQASSEHFRAVLQAVASDVQGGRTLSEALEAFPKVFPIVMTSLVRASEVSGTMGPMLQRISKYLAKQQKIKRQARGAMMYPCFMLTVCLSVLIFLIMFVLPRFSDIYAQKGAALPAPTRLLLGISNTFTLYGWYIGGGFLAAIIGFFVFRSTARGRSIIDWLKINAPVARKLFTSLYVTRACGTMGTMVKAGVPMLDAVSIVRDVTDNVHYREMWDRVDESLKQGMQLSDPLFESDLMPRSVAQMVRSGEKAGRLGEVLDRVAEFTEEEFDETVKVTSQFIEPLMIGIMGIAIGFIAIALLLPIFSVGKVMAG